MPKGGLAFAPLDGVTLNLNCLESLDVFELGVAPAWAEHRQHAIDNHAVLVRRPRPRARQKDGIASPAQRLRHGLHPTSNIFLRPLLLAAAEKKIKDLAFRPFLGDAVNAGQKLVMQI